MTKFTNMIGVNYAIMAGMDITQLGLVPVTLHLNGGAEKTYILRGEKVFVTAARTCLVANGVPCVGVTTDAEIVVCEGKRPSLGQTSRVSSDTVVFDRKNSALSFMDTVETAVEKAREASKTTSAMAERLRRIKEIRANHPKLLKQDHDCMRAEAFKRTVDRKAGRLRAREVTDEKLLDKVSYACMKRRMVLGIIPWDTATYEFYNKRSAKGVAAVLARSAVQPAEYPERFVQKGCGVTSEFFSVRLNEWLPRKGVVKMATEHGARQLVELLDSVRKGASK